MNLPPLPIKNFLGADGLWEEQYGPYTADQMREYGEACRKQALEEVAQIADHTHPSDFAFIGAAIRRLIK